MMERKGRWKEGEGCREECKKIVVSLWSAGGRKGQSVILFP